MPGGDAVSEQPKVDELTIRVEALKDAICEMAPDIDRGKASIFSQALTRLLELALSRATGMASATVTKFSERLEAVEVRAENLERMVGERHE
jgi:hypothetical protein